ncbi:MAG: hypothetical protein ACRBI6_21175 [Acidimicrobiales bacterium]
MYQFQPRRFGGDDGWFNIGTVSFSTTGVFALLAMIGMVIRSIEGAGGAVTTRLIMNGDSVGRGQVWRLLTWFIPNAVSIWVVIGAVVLFFLGREVDRSLGRDRSLQFGLVLLLIPSVLATVSWWVLPDSVYESAGFRGYPVVFGGLSSYLSRSVFLAFVLRMPKALFFGGIPAWVMAAVFIGLDYLELLADRRWGGMIFLSIVMLGVWLACNAFGLISSAGDDFRMAGTERGGGFSADYGSGPVEPGFLDKLKERFKRSPKGVAEPTNLADYRTPVGSDNYDALGIDAILDQIAERGVDSLTAEQRRVLDLYKRDR